MHSEGYTPLEIQGWQGLFLSACLTTVVHFQFSVLTKCSSEGVIWMCRASITSSSCLPLSSINVSFHIGWLVVLCYNWLLHHPLLADILVVSRLQALYGLEIILHIARKTDCITSKLIHWLHAQEWDNEGEEETGRKKRQGEGCT